MDFCYDPDFDLLLEELSHQATSSEDFSLSSSSSDSTSITSTNNRRKKHKASDYAGFTDDSSIDSDLPLIKPRMLRSDIRRSYAAMFLNVFNSADLPVMYGFFDTFFTPSMQSVFSRPDCAGGQGRLTMKQSGMLETVRFWWTSFACKSDAVLRMKECKVVTPVHSNGSQVVFSFNFQATILYDENQFPKDLLNNNQGDTLADENISTCSEVKNMAGSKRNKRDELLEKTSAMKDIMSSVDSMISRLSLRSQPVHIDSDGVITMDLDENKCITKLFMNCKPGVLKCGPECAYSQKV